MDHDIDYAGAGKNSATAATITAQAQNALLMDHHSDRHCCKITPPPVKPLLLLFEQFTNHQEKRYAMEVGVLCAIMPVLQRMRQGYHYR